MCTQHRIDCGNQAVIKSGTYRGKSDLISSQIQLSTLGTIWQNNTRFRARWYRIARIACLDAIKPVENGAKSIKCWGKKNIPTSSRPLRLVVRPNISQHDTAAAWNRAKQWKYARTIMCLIPRRVLNRKTVIHNTTAREWWRIFRLEQPAEPAYLITWRGYGRWRQRGSLFSEKITKYLDLSTW